MGRCPAGSLTAEAGSGLGAPPRPRGAPGPPPLQPSSPAPCPSLAGRGGAGLTAGRRPLAQASSHEGQVSQAEAMGQGERRDRRRWGGRIPEGRGPPHPLSCCPARRAGLSQTRPGRASPAGLLGGWGDGLGLELPKQPRGEPAGGWPQQPSLHPQAGPGGDPTGSPRPREAEIPAHAPARPRRALTVRALPQHAPRPLNPLLDPLSTTPRPLSDPHAAPFSVPQPPPAFPLP